VKRQLSVIAGLLAVIVVASAHARTLSSTAAKPTRQQWCRQQLEFYVDAPLAYPVKVFGGKQGFVLFAHAEKVAALSERKRVAMMRLVACAFAGVPPRPVQDDYDLVDPDTHKVIEHFPISELWPPTGRPH
jgi:hypothetical protein